jgi:hypothetical protein
LDLVLRAVVDAAAGLPPDAAALLWVEGAGTRVLWSIGGAG